MIIKRIRTLRKGLKVEIKGLIKKYLGVDIYKENKSNKGRSTARIRIAGKQDRFYEEKGNDERKRFG